VAMNDTLFLIWHWSDLSKGLAAWWYSKFLGNVSTLLCLHSHFQLGFHY